VFLGGDKISPKYEEKERGKKTIVHTLKVKKQDALNRAPCRMN
jgi:hypothetical protein